MGESHNTKGPCIPKEAPSRKNPPGAPMYCASVRLFSSFVWSKAIVRNACWEPLGGVEPPHVMVFQKPAKENLDLCPLQVCTPSFSILLDLMFAARALHMVMPCFGGNRFLRRNLSQLFRTSMYFIHAVCSHARCVHQV